MMTIRVEKWNDYNIRFVERDGEWFAILKDICDALDLKTFKVSQRLDPGMLIRVRIDSCDIPSKYTTSRKTKDMLAVNEIGIYEALFASRKLEARQFRRWSATVLQKLRKRVGLSDYEIMRMADSDVQDRVDAILDTLFYDETTGKLMESITVQGGDVDQVEFE